MTKQEKFGYFVRGLLAYLLEPIVKCAPRNSKKWLFGSVLGTFKDNPKYLFYETVETHTEIRAIWIGRDKNEIADLRKKGYEAYFYFSPKGLFHALTSKVYVCDHNLGDINNYLSGGAFYVNLWHGVSVKKVKWQAPAYFVRQYGLKEEKEMKTSFSFKMMEYSNLFRLPDLCLAPSEIQMKDFFAPMMNIPLDKCVVGSYPRSRLMIEGEEVAHNFILKHESKVTKDLVEKMRLYRKVYIYMPTWRKDGRDFISQSGIIWNELEDVLNRRNELLILKLHPFTKIDVSGLSNSKNILIYPPSSDIYTILPFIDCLITDYSSVYTDFLIMDKEIILYTFDYNEYISDSYELAEYDKYFVGKRVMDFDQLLKTIDSGEKCKVPRDKYEFLMRYFWGGNENRIDIVNEIKRRIS